MKKSIIILVLANLLLHPTFSQQSVSINNTGSTANSSAILDVASNDKGMLIPRMTTAQRTGILNSAVGLMVFDISTNSFWYYQTSGWTELQSTTTNPWQKNGNNIYNNNLGNVGVGLVNPGKKLEVKGGIKADSIFIAEGNSGDFLIKNASGDRIGFKKGFSGLGLNYCIAIQGIYPSRSGPVRLGNTDATLGTDVYIGEIILFAGNFAPLGYAFCNGQLLPINQNQALFSLLGTTYGGNGQTTFALPNLQGAVPIHFGNNWILGENNR